MRRCAVSILLTCKAYTVCQIRARTFGLANELKARWNICESDAPSIRKDTSAYVRQLRTTLVRSRLFPSVSRGSGLPVCLFSPNDVGTNISVMLRNFSRLTLPVTSRLAHCSMVRRSCGLLYHTGRLTWNRAVHRLGAVLAYVDLKRL